MRMLKTILIILLSLASTFIVLTFWDQNLPTYFAAEGDVNAMKFLLSKGVDLNQQKRRNYPLIAAAQSRHAEMVSLLLRNGANPNFRSVDSSTALIWAAKQNDPLVAAKLIDTGADVNLQDQLSASALWYAVRSDSYPIVVMLLRAGANVHPGPEGITPATLASQNGDRRIMDLLASWHEAKISNVKDK